MKSSIALGAAWGSVVISFAADHWSAILSGLAAFAAFTASAISVYINILRAKREKLKLEEEQEEVVIKHNPPCDSP